MKKVTVKEYFSTLFGGLWQAVLWVVGLFGYKDDSKFGTVIKRIFATCATILIVLFTAVTVVCFAHDIIYLKCIKPIVSDEVSSEENICGNIGMQYMMHGDNARLYNYKSNKVILEDIEYTEAPNDNDSLAIFRRNDKYGYVNCYTGVVVIPETYDDAWIYSDGLAAVEKDDQLLFIDTRGNIVIDKDICPADISIGYGFKNGYCEVMSPANNKVGLIDKAGNWAIAPEYDCISNTDGFWCVEKGDYHGLYTSELRPMFPVEYDDISVYDGTIEVLFADHTAKKYDYEGNVISDFVIHDVIDLLYETTEVYSSDIIYVDEKDDSRTYARANCKCYNVGAYSGLLGQNGEIVTQPIYTSIDAIDANLYLCEPHGVIINDRGQIIKQQ